ncbi:phage terminase large subunit [Psychrobacillus sp. BM2]|uniref:phage terminase large subunit n=1 Tax=Psychrobacillus sp. BM2 TaxID=3400421 RepID=UPI003B029306
MSVIKKDDKLAKLILLKELKIKKARENFYEFCKVINPQFFTKGKEGYTKEICDTLQSLYQGNLLKKNGEQFKNISINLPPSFGKSYMAKLFSAWMLGDNLKNQIMTASYNEDFATLFSKEVRGFISEGKSPESFGVQYGDIYPEIKLKHGNSSAGHWAVEGNYMSFAATSPGGSSTGKRGNIHIIDDLIKDHNVAFNEKELQHLFEWYANTFLSRKSQGGITIMISTRWATSDVCGKLISKNPDDWYVLTMPACIDEAKKEMLCDEICNWDTYISIREIMSPLIFSANYLQKPLDFYGRLYSSFKQYTKLPTDELNRPIFEKIIAYIDTADKGSDYLCAIVAGVYQKELFVLDVLYTKDDMSITERQTAEMLNKHEVNIAHIESNNGGQGFARSVERILRGEFNNHLTTIKPFHQSKNKESRILSMSSAVERLVYFPSNWLSKWNEFYLALISFQREFKKNKFDDSADCITGLVETIENTAKPITAVKSIYNY